MSKAYSLLVGLKGVDSNSYNGWDGTNGCWGCELDVDNIERILKPIGYQIKILKTAEATHDNILSSLYRTAENMVSGDTFVFYYSGHGGQQLDINGDEPDGKDETLEKFKTGVHIIMISDSCNSGTNFRGRRDISVNEEAIFRPVARNSKRNVNIKAQLIHIGGCRDGFTSWIH
ncbi:MAG: caspase family protein [Candidatus Anammoxibacter sp.]